MYRKQLLAWASYVCVVGVSLLALLPALLAQDPDCNSMQPPMPAPCGTGSACVFVIDCTTTITVVQLQNVVQDCVAGTPSQYGAPPPNPVPCTKTKHFMDDGSGTGCVADMMNPVRDSNWNPVQSTNPSCVLSSCIDQT